MIAVQHLTKRYGNHTAVSDLSFTIEKGQIYGFLGPNGAGKSTTMNIMAGCLAATAGDVKIDGYDIFEQSMEAKRRIGYLPEQPPLYPDRTPREYLTFVARAKRIPEKEIPGEIQKVMDITQITEKADRLCKNLSKGYRQRVGIAQAILGNPEIVILDEPTVGLDPRQIIEIRELIRTLGREHTVILSSHILSEVQAVCQTILIISKGKLVACDTPDNLEKLFAGTATVRLTAEGEEETIRTLLQPLPFITALEINMENRPAVGQTEETTVPETNGDTAETVRPKATVRIDTDRADADAICRDIFFAFSAAGCPILQMTTEKASLEDIFIELTAGEPAAVAESATQPVEKAAPPSAPAEEPEYTSETQTEEEEAEA